jgi:hypothetical protein
MTKSATDLMQEVLFAAVIDGIVALKAASKGLPNTLLRDLNAIHANTTLADLPPELQASLQASVRAAFTKLLRDGYSVSPAAPGARPAMPRREGAPTGGHRREGPGGRPQRPGSGPGGAPRPPRGGPGRPNRGPRPPSKG